MRPQKVLENDLMEGLSKTFRAFGYEGASLKELSDETGLKKASLYHRFPNGKQEMAESVLAYLDQWVEKYVFSALADEKYNPATRLKNGLEQIAQLYKKGENMCIFRALSMDTGLQLFENNLKEGMQQWINSFINIGLAFHLSPKNAKQLAIQNLIDIQGSLVLSKILHDTTIFENVLKNIEERYIT